MLCLPLASGAPLGAALPRRSSLAPQSRHRRAPPARSCCQDAAIIPLQHLDDNDPEAVAATSRKLERRVRAACATPAGDEELAHALSGHPCGGVVVAAECLNKAVQAGGDQECG